MRYRLQQRGASKCESAPLCVSNESIHFLLHRRGISAYSKHIYSARIKFVHYNPKMRTDAHRDFAALRRASGAGKRIKVQALNSFPIYVQNTADTHRGEALHSNAPLCCSPYFSSRRQSQFRAAVLSSYSRRTFIVCYNPSVISNKKFLHIHHIFGKISHSLLLYGQDAAISSLIPGLAPRLSGAVDKYGTRKCRGRPPFAQVSPQRHNRKRIYSFPIKFCLL